MNKILVIAAHPDDEILGIGGTVRKHVNKGDKVWCLILGEGMLSRKDVDKILIDQLHQDTLSAAAIVGYEEVFFEDFPDNRFDSVSLLDITQKVEKYIEELKPNIIYTHHSGDLNVDHRITYEAVMTATRPFGDYSVQEIYTFETPSSTEWVFNKEGDIFSPNTFIDITDTLDAKISAMACYSTELRDYPHPRSLKGLEVLAAKWGVVVGKQYIEALYLVRKVE